MKKLIYTATITLACISSIPVSLVASSIGSAAYATEQACQAISGQATTGGAIREHLSAIASCRSTNQQHRDTGTSFNRIKSVTPVISDTNSVESEPNSYPAYCSFLPRGVEPGDFSYREALYRCKYGS